MRVSADLGKRPEAAGPDQLAGLARFDHHHVDVTAEESRNPLAARRERNVRPVGFGVGHEHVTYHCVAGGHGAARLLQRCRATLSPRR